MLSVSQIQDAWPEQGLFSGKNWLLSPEPLRLPAREIRDLERMGPILAAFQQAQDRLYRRSAKGRVAPWLAELLDAGKPDWLVAWQRNGAQAEVVPQVIRPDLMLTDEGFAISELDSVPGGMGVTAWLASLYPEALGGPEGMSSGLQSILSPEGRRIFVSEEAADYRPEMEWLAERMEGVTVHRAEDWRGEAGYRFFELFDWENIPALAGGEGRTGLTPPLKPHFEEKLWLALLHTPGLQALWRQELRGKHLSLLQKWVPRGWVPDPTPLPPFAALPGLEVPSWDEVGALSQKERRLVLKVSGFSAQAWGSRGVHIGHDEPGERWAGLVKKAVAERDSQPWMMQEFKEAKLIEHPYFDPESGAVEVMSGRARLCPYYFVTAEGVTLGGCLATIVPADKKKIHGMEDAILVPVAPEQEA
ncbi:hypothetical protein [Roseibacillus ishigakijimensis]|uniref:Glutathionylspermidine synthase n=1 Tax=Roseibacillus ishigakijimensis TaxID=454146 RepID=A0A934RM43_9BACT|nr:hypothetical protein [Roseibacillus ishigakijimensis]MBK1834292.1 hypothetical protein [Roseibacillus ishigakijimensis]